MLKRCTVLLLALSLLVSCVIPAGAADLYEAAINDLKCYLTGEKNSGIANIHKLLGEHAPANNEGLCITQYAKCLMLVEQGEFGRIAPILRTLRMSPEFMDYLETEGLVPLDKLEYYTEGRKAEAAGEYEAAIAYYQKSTVMPDVMGRIFMLMDKVYTEKKAKADALMDKNTVEACREAAQIYRELAQTDPEMEKLAAKADKQAAALTTPVPTATPTPKPTATPTPKPTATPTLKPTPTPTATPKPDAITASVSENGNSRTITVKASGKWTATDNAAWITLSKTSGNGNATITATLAENPSTKNSRSGKVTFKCGTASYSLTITQDKAAVQVEIGDEVLFGHYEQDGDTGNGKEFIHWIVYDISGEYALLYAVNVLDVQPYDTRGKTEDWLNCSLRKWLNADFCNAAFTEEEQQKLRQGKPFNNEYFSKDDRVFLLAYDSYVTPINGNGLGGLSFASNYTGQYKGRGLETHYVAPGTQYALNRAANGTAYYWEYRGTLADNSEHGCFYGGENPKDSYGVRPACWVALDALSTLAANTTRTALKVQTVGDYEITPYSDRTCTINKYNGIDAKLTIPGTLNGYKVTVIGEKAFYDNDSLTSVVLPEGVVEIENRAFCWCSKLKSVDFPDSLKRIGYSSFWAPLTTVDLPEGLESIGWAAFDGCLFTSVHIPASVKSVSEISFGGCTKLQKITVASGNKNYKVVNNALVSNDGILICYPMGRTDVSYKVPENITKIGAGAFEDSMYLQEVIIPHGVTVIENYAFRGCEALKTVILPHTATQIGSQAFMNAAKLTSLEIPDSVRGIASNAFDYCEKLTLIVTKGSYAETYAKENDIKYTYAK